METEHDDKSINLSYCLVAFVDVLGQKEELRKINRLPDMQDPNQKAQLINLVKNTYGVVEHFYEAFEDYFEGLKKTHLNFLPPEFSEMLRRSDIKYQTFTDGIVVYTSLEERNKRIPIQDVYGILGACASVLILFLSVGRPVRGGLEIGVGIETQRHGIYGPVVMDAYELEKNVAQFPRIAVGSNALKYLKSEEHLSQEKVLGRYRVRMAQICESIIGKDEKGVYFIDYLVKGFKDHIAGNLLEDLPVKAYDFILKQIDKWKEEGNEKLLRRYYDLKSYFDSKMDIWIR